jgi:DNA sulfur modification protein DndD
MILSEIRLTNYKQFRKEQVIRFKTDGSITIIYGFNGHGKTRLHSFFHWFFYGRDRDNEVVYNKPQMQHTICGDKMEVNGEIAFIHNGVKHVMYRIDTYKKIDESNARKVGSELILRRQGKNGNMNLIDRPDRYVAQIFPEALSKYFFFDGEGMADELVGSKTASNGKSLSDAINTIFGLKLYENAVKDIGTIDRKNNAINDLTRRLVSEGDDIDIELLNQRITDHGEQKKLLEEQNNQNQDEISRLTIENQALSEKIGKFDSADALEQRRSDTKRRNEKIEESKGNMIKGVGKLFSNKIVFNIVSHNTKRAQEIIQSNIDENFVMGINRKLIENILGRNRCICGISLDDQMGKTLTNYLDMLPPASFGSVFMDYKKDADRLIRDSKEAILELEEKQKELAKLDQEQLENNDIIDEVEMELKKFDSVRSLAEKRKKNEESIKRLRSSLEQNIGTIKQNDLKISSDRVKLQNATKNIEANKKLNMQINFLEKAHARLSKMLESKKAIYREKLEENIKAIVKDMLSVTRGVTLNDNYTLEVKDDTFGDTALSKGQAAMISFSYIGGIIDTLKKLNVEYVTREYPLILDAPLSHLDNEHIDKLFRFLPQFSNQLIIFSKENLSENLDERDQVDCYQIVSNDQQNISDIVPFIGEEYFESKEKRSIYSYGV